MLKFKYCGEATKFEKKNVVFEITLRSLLKKLAHLRIVTILKRASSFNRDLRVHSNAKTKWEKFFFRSLWPSQNILTLSLESRTLIHIFIFQLYEDYAFFRDQTLVTFLSHILKALDDISVPVDPAMKKTLEQHQIFK